MWTTSGSGAFGNTTSLSTTYSPSAADIAAGSVTLTLTSTNAAAPCPEESASTTLTINAIPPAPVVSSPVCVNNAGMYDLSTITTVTNWYSDAVLTMELTGTALTVSPTTSTTYYGVFDNGNCVSLASSLVVNPLPTVTMSALAEVCASASTFPLTIGSPTGGTYSGTGVVGGTDFNPAVAGAGTHTITYSYTDPTTGCMNTATTSITVDPIPVISNVVTGCVLSLIHI